MKAIYYYSILICTLLFSACKSDDYILSIDKDDIVEKSVNINFSCIGHYKQSGRNYHIVKCTATISGYHGKGDLNISTTGSTRNDLYMDYSESFPIQLEGEEANYSFIFDCWSPSNAYHPSANFRVSFPKFTTVVGHSCNYY